MKKWMPQQVLSCSLCGKVNDSINHLFFQCEYSDQIWRNLKKKLIFRGLPNRLDDIISMLSRYPYTSNIWNFVNRVLLASCVYFLWQERNSRLFKKRKRSVNELENVIQDHIKMKLMLIKVKNSSAVKAVASLWNLQLSADRLVLK
ncbi:uncharacterized protein [Rutidosis leptorrhynchoides]|uniref:uncharacterized protein n=1 Tax=Rutidosis leptorrhynchoides TaxID=125765 RepID=UPI003A9A284F